MLPSELDELKAYRQWVVHRADKVPLRVADGKRASNSNPDDWASYSEALAICQLHNELGLGFVLTDNDPLAFIDLDNPHNPKLNLTPEEIQTAIAAQTQIFNTFISYSEKSPSGNGLHIIAKGVLPSGKRDSKKCVEIYTSGRYMTITGNVFRAEPITDHAHKLMQLYEQMGGSQIDTSKNPVPDQPETKTDSEIFEIARSAADGQKFMDLWNGVWQSYYPTHSEADIALASILGFYTDNRYQCMRLFKLSALGKREKAQRNDYYFHPEWGIVTKAFDRKQMPVSLDELKANAAQSLKELAIVKSDDVKQPLRQIDWTCPPGMLGDIATYIYDASYRPVKEVALAGAIALMAGIVGRAFNISGTGLNQYIMLLANTGRGKEGARSGINKLVNTIAIQQPIIEKCLGPKMESPQGLLRHLSEESQSCVTIMGEVGLWMQQVCNKYAKHNELGIRRALLDLYSVSGRGESISASSYSDKSKNIKRVLSPAFSMFGESTQDEFYKAIDESNIAEGFLPRLTVIEYNGIRPDSNTNEDGSPKRVQPKQDLVWKIVSLVRRCADLNGQNMVKDIQMTKDAALYLRKFEKEIDRKINTTPEDEKGKAELWNRVYLKVVKLAGLLAVGIDISEPVVTIELAKWAEEVVVHGTEVMLHRFDNGGIGEQSYEAAQRKSLAQTLKTFIMKGWNDDYEASAGISREMYAAAIVTDRYLQTRLKSKSAFRMDKNPSLAYANAIRSLMDAGHLVPADMNKHNRRGRGYHILDVSKL